MAPAEADPEPLVLERWRACLPADGLWATRRERGGAWPTGAETNTGADSAGEWFGVLLVGWCWWCEWSGAQHHG